jgi:hypothetical protein
MFRMPFYYFQQARVCESQAARPGLCILDFSFESLPECITSLGSEKSFGGYSRRRAIAQGMCKN